MNVVFLVVRNKQAYFSAPLGSRTDAMRKVMSSMPWDLPQLLTLGWGSRLWHMPNGSKPKLRGQVLGRPDVLLMDEVIPRSDAHHRLAEVVRLLLSSSNCSIIPNGPYQVAKWSCFCCLHCVSRS